MKDLLMSENSLVYILVAIISFILGNIFQQIKKGNIIYKIQRIKNKFLFFGVILFIAFLLVLHFIIEDITYTIIMTFLYFAIYLLIGIRFIAKDCKNIGCDETRCDLIITRSYAKASMILFIISGIIGVLIVIGKIIVEFKG